MKHQIVCFLVLISLVTSCAQQRAPSGGERDTDPPILLQSIPPNLSINFNAKKVVLEFDEYIQLVDAYGQIIISPPFKKEPKTQIRGKKVIITLPDTLLPNTTYTINFGESIVDLTEGNPASGFTYVFSTGTFIDSLEVGGSISNALSEQPVEGMLVMLYEQLEDSLPYSVRPNYFAKTNKEGTFLIRFIKEGKYKLFALKDGNMNYLFDSPLEEIAFTKDSVIPGIIDSLYDPFVFRSFMEEDTAQFIVNTSTREYGELMIELNNPADSVSIIPITPDNAAIEFTTEIVPTRDTVRAWLSGLENVESMDVAVIADGEVLDTIFWFLPPFNERDQSALKIVPNSSAGQHDQKNPFRIKFNQPLTIIDTTLITLLKDTIPVNPDIYRDSLNYRTLNVQYDYKSGERYALTALPGAFTGFLGDKNDTLKLDYYIREENFYGEILMKVNFEEGMPQDPALLQMLDQNGKIINQRIIKDGETEVYSRLNPNVYSFRIVFDKNENGKWDTGNYLKNVQPEHVANYKNSIQVRSNWTMELEWKINSSDPE